MKNKRIHKFLLLALCAALTLPGAAPAFADENVPQTAVTTASADVKSAYTEEQLLSSGLLAVAKATGSAATLTDEEEKTDALTAVSAVLTLLQKDAADSADRTFYAESADTLNDAIREIRAVQTETGVQEQADPSAAEQPEDSDPASAGTSALQTVQQVCASILANDPAAGDATRFDAWTTAAEEEIRTADLNAIASDLADGKPSFNYEDDPEKKTAYVDTTAALAKAFDARDSGDGSDTGSKRNDSDAKPEDSSTYSTASADTRSTDSAAKAGQQVRIDVSNAGEDTGEAGQPEKTCSGEIVSANQVLSVMAGWIGRRMGTTASTDTHRNIVDIYNSYTPRARGYRASYTDNYCDISLSAAFISLQAVDMIGGPECGVQRHVQLFIDKGIWLGKTDSPRRGDIIVYDWDHNGWADHIGIVRYIYNNRIYTIEGNINSGEVGGRQISISSSDIRGYARPDYRPDASPEPSFAKVESFVTRLYRLCLGRNPDNAGLLDWSYKLASTVLTASDVVHGFFYSPELQAKSLSNGDFVELCYRTMMNRASDAGGKANWVRALESGRDWDYVLYGFINSKEFADICKSYGVRQGTIEVVDPKEVNPAKTRQVTAFVTRLYDKCLNRKPDAAGLDDWVVRILTADDPRAAAMATATDGFYHSAEFLNRRTSDSTFVKILYEAFLNREYDRAGFADWTNRLAYGTSRDSVIFGFAYSDEFQELLKSYGF